MKNRRPISKELIDNGQGKYLMQLPLTYDEAKLLDQCINSKLAELRKDKTLKATPDYTRAKYLKSLLETDILPHLKYAYQKRAEGRFKSKLSNNQTKDSDDN